MLIASMSCVPSTPPDVSSTARPTSTVMALEPTAMPTLSATPVPPTSSPVEIATSPVVQDDVVLGGEAWQAEKGAVEMVPATDLPVGADFETVLRISTVVQPSRLIDLHLAVPTVQDVEVNDVLWLSFYARAVEINAVEPTAYLKVYFQQEYPILHWMRPVDKVLPLHEQWQHVALPFVANEAYESGAAALYFAVGFLPQTVEIGGVKVVSYGETVDPAELETTPAADAAYDGYAWGTVDYPGRDPDAGWRAEAQERIETYRKGDLTIRVEDADGTPVPDAAVQVSMTRHAYGFGSAVAAKWLTDESEDGERYRSVVEDHYNKIVFENDLKYGPWEAGKTASPGDYFVRANTFASLAWLTERDIAIRGHTLIWGPIRKTGYNRAFDFEDEAEASREALLTHLEERLADTQSYVSEWDVINHPVATFGDNGNRLDLVYGLEFYVEAMARARAAHPDLVAYVNEGNVLKGGGRNRDAYEAFIRHLIDEGQGPDGIGFMCHFDEGSLISPEIVLKRLDRFAEFGLPLQVTEFDVDTMDVKAQADYLRDFMTIVFSHPATEGFIMWGFWEGQHWRPSAALYRNDWSLKPNGQVWLDLVEDAWWTEAEGATDAEGRYATRGFLGEYEITVTIGEQTRSLPAVLIRQGTEVVVTLE
jgi:GH35 family endo-1,4-beta-xylanase